MTNYSVLKNKLNFKIPVTLSSHVQRWLIFIKSNCTHHYPITRMCNIINNCNKNLYNFSF